MKTRQGEEATAMLRRLILQKAADIKQKGSTPAIYIDRALFKMLWEYYPTSLLRCANNAELYFEGILLRITDSLNMEFTVVDDADRTVLSV